MSTAGGSRRFTRKDQFPGKNRETVTNTITVSPAESQPTNVNDSVSFITSKGVSPLALASLIHLISMQEF